MSRSLRIEHVGGWYHVTARGNERKAIFREDWDRAHFLELLERMTERFAVRLHCYVLMDLRFRQWGKTPKSLVKPLKLGRRLFHDGFLIWRRFFAC